MMEKDLMGVDDTMLTLIEAVLASGTVVQAAQDSLVEEVFGTAKVDGSEYTDTDIRSEAVGCRILERLGMPIWTEESKRPKLLTTTARLVLYDPLDGTSYFKNGMYGVTVIASVVDEQGAVIACVVGDVDKNRIFFASKGCGTWVFKYRGNLERDITTARRCTVSGAVSGKKAISVDLTTGFTKEGYQTIPNEAYGQLFARLFGPYKIQIGPNGINHALVAFGRGGVVGSITTALGGPWDVAPVLLILEAGGFALGHRNGIPVDPHFVMDYNMLVTAATQSVLVDLSGHVVQTCYPNN